LITRVYDVRGDLVSELFVERRTVLPLSQIPLDFQRAVIAIEDDIFYSHPGVDVKGILRAFLTNLRKGHTAQGGSTITQQLAKNIFLTQERTFARKIKELLMTLQIERNFSKDEILQLYLNQIYFGHGAYGIEAAARIFFGKPAQELGLAECALLAGLPKWPSRYSPFNHPDRAIQRRNVVLRRMRNLGYITEQEELRTQGHALKMTPSPQMSTASSYFIESLRQELDAKYGSDVLYRGGLSVYTTLDLRMQGAAERAMQRHLSAFDEQHAEQRMLFLLKNKKIKDSDYKEWKRWKELKTPEPKPLWIKPEPVSVQGALVAIDPQTGGVRAMVGGRDFQKSQFNRAVQAKRQPGSTFKPFVWLAALESGYTAATLVDDYPIAYTDVTTHPQLIAEATDYATLREMVTSYYQPNLPAGSPDPVWAPQNWDYKFLGPITLRKGLALSRNLVSVRLIDRVGPKAVADLAHKAGIASDLSSVLSLGLGSSVVTVQEMVSAFSTFANDGVHMTPFSIQKVVDREDRVLEEHVVQGQQAFSSQSNYLITRLMQAVVQEGTGRHASRLGRPVAGKTGTTQDMRDAWFMGFLPDLAAGCWIGYDDFTPLGKGITSAGTSVPLWTEFMMEAGKYVPSRDFPVPSGIVFAKIDSDTGLLALPSCKHVTLEAFREGQVPKEFCAVDHEDIVEIPVEVEITE
jgi:penicillin-binding protein 1A